MQTGATIVNTFMLSLILDFMPYIRNLWIPNNPNEEMNSSHQSVQAVLSPSSLHMPRSICSGGGALVYLCMNGDSGLNYGLP